MSKKNYPGAERHWRFASNLLSAVRNGYGHRYLINLSLTFSVGV